MVAFMFLYVLCLFPVEGGRSPTGTGNGQLPEPAGFVQAMTWPNWKN